ncbi:MULTISPECIES: glycosyltransferase [unclassified Mycobacterium]|uniref:glycosyltransferase n=1 Tax=unclassified Mycobacterium TaxID=2642494 RepID=UPI0029C6C090|nr:MULTISPECIES: glycosyltransferase [unclassified Mycobacterium]
MLWLSPWMRPLARIHVEALRAAGAEVLLVTSDQHPSSDAPRPYELVVDPRPKTARTWPEAARAASHVRQFAPNVVVSEIVRDPRWMAFAPGVPRIELIHDDRPHDDGETLPRWERSVFGWWASRSSRTVAFSEYVAQSVRAGAVVPLTSDLEDISVPPVVEAANRRNFVLVGRLNEYKNIDVCLQAWELHTGGDGWRGDDLLLLGERASEWRQPLPRHVQWRHTPFRYADVLPVLARAKGSIVHYRRASQSGVQVLSMQLGVVPIVSGEGALPEFQPPGETPIAVDDVEALARAFDALADPQQATMRGAAARAHYVRRYSAAASSAALVEVLQEVALNVRPNTSQQS